MARAGSEFQVASFDPCLHSVFRGGGGAAGASSTHVGDTLSCREPDIPFLARKFLARGSGDLTVHEEMPCACGDGAVPGELFLCAVDPGEFRPCRQTPADHTDLLGATSTPPVVRRN